MVLPGIKFFNYDILIITIMITLIYDLNFATQRSDISFLTQEEILVFDFIYVFEDTF